MRSFIIAILLIFAAPARSAEPCTEQDYSDPAKEPNWECPGPGESIILPDIKFQPSIGLPEGMLFQKPGNDGKPVEVKLKYPAVLMDKEKALQLGLRIQGLRRLRWLDTHRGTELLGIEKKYVGDRLQAKLDLEKERTASFKDQMAHARRELAQAKRWYRSWTFGFAAGIVITAGSAAAIAYAASR